MFQQTLRNFSINLDALNERNTWTGGDLMTGRLTFDLTKDTKISSIVLTVRGKAHVHWSTSGGGGGRRRRRRRNISAKLEFFNIKSALLQDTSVTTKLQPGTHVYPFSCQLPQGNFPSSFRGAHGQISYTLSVSVSRPWHLAKDFVTEFNFVHHIDANQSDMLAPLAGSNSMTLCCLWCASGPITMTVRLERKAFVPGETVKIACQFGNGSSRTATAKACLSQKQAFYTHNKSSKLILSKPLAAAQGPAVRPRTDEDHAVNTDILLCIPPSVAYTVSNCSILEVSYCITVSLGVKASPDLVVLFPIVICDTPPYVAPPPY